MVSKHSLREDIDGAEQERKYNEKVNTVNSRFRAILCVDTFFPVFNFSTPAPAYTQVFIDGLIIDEALFFRNERKLDTKVVVAVYTGRAVCAAGL